MANAPPHPSGPGGIHPQPPPPGSTPPSSQSSNVEIHVSCHNLTNMDVFSKSDPLVVLFTEERGHNGKFWKEHGRTEVIQDNLNPRFVTPFKIQFQFEQHQNLKFEVYDCDSEDLNLEKHDFIGQAVITMGSIMGEYCSTVTKPLMDRDRRKLPSSTITLTAEEMVDSKEVLLLQFKGKKLDRKDFFGSSDPFLVISRTAVEDDSFMPVHKTEVIKKNLNPSWKSFELPLATLCNGDVLRPIRIECYDWDYNGSHDLIGSCETTVDDMLAAGDGFKRPLINEQKRKKKRIRRYKNSGELILQRISAGTTVSFLDYITGRMELCFHVAIDFTMSNGAPTQPSSLHYLGQDTPNQYVQALLSVGEICEDYDSDKLMPAYGFGAKIDGQIYHAFHLNSAPNPECHGVMGVLEAYKQSLSRVELYEPTNFSPVINLVKDIAAQQESDVEKYHVLLVLTDGEITDMDETKMAIIEASKHPMSIIIVGVGTADFESMDELDCDAGLLSHDGYTANHDIVQFVPYNKFDGVYASEDLADEVLREVPTQLVNFMKSRDIKPAPKPEPRSDVLHFDQEGTGPTHPGAVHHQNHHNGPSTYTKQTNTAPYQNQQRVLPYRKQSSAGPHQMQPGAPSPNPKQTSNMPRYSRHNSSYG